MLSHVESIIHLLRYILNTPFTWVDTNHKLGFHVEMLTNFDRHSNKFHIGIIFFLGTIHGI
jgi:hypothetical protein